MSESRYYSVQFSTATLLGPRTVVRRAAAVLAVI